MDEQAWKDELATYTNVKQILDEVLEGVTDHLETPCQTSEVVTHYVRNRYTGVGPVESAAICNRGTVGCNLFHNELQALKFTRLGLERAVELVSG